MTRWMPFGLWFVFFWPVIGLAETIWQDLGQPLFTGDGGIALLILAIVWLVILFWIKPEKEEAGPDWDDDEEEDILPNAVIIVTCVAEPKKFLTRELNVEQPPEVGKYIVIENDVVFPTSANVTQVGQVFDNSSIKWRIAARVDFKEQFEQLAASSDWEAVTVSK